MGIVLMFVGFTGSGWDVEVESALHPGARMEVGGYSLRYDGPRNEADPNKQMIFADLTVFDADGVELDSISPAKFIYRTHPQMPTTEVYIRSRLASDLYVILSTVDPQSGRATFRAMVRPLVIWIWIGGILLVFAGVFAIWPTTKQVLARIDQLRGLRRRAGGSASALLLLLCAAAALHLLSASRAQAQSEGGGTLHAGTVVITDPEERQLFSRLLCECGSCERLPLDTCACGWAENARAEIRGRLASGYTPEEVQAQYRAEHGAAALTVPDDSGFNRGIWAIPLVLIAAAAFGVLRIGRRWKRTGNAPGPSEPSAEGGASGAYEDRLDDELAQLEEEDV